MIKLSKVPRIELDRALLDRTIWKIASDVKDNIQKRTKSGKDVNGTEFHEYSEGYQKYKQKRGLTGNRVTLTNKGTMLNSLKLIKIAIAWVRLYIADTFAAEYGYYHQRGVGKMPKREWFGVSKQDADEIYKKHFFGLNIGKFK